MEIYRSKYGYLYSVALRTLKEASNANFAGGFEEKARDVVQIIFERVLDDLDRFSEIGNLEGYLSVMARHQALDIARNGVHGGRETLYGNLADLAQAEADEYSHIGKAIGRTVWSNGKSERAYAPDMAAEKIMTDRLLKDFYAHVMDGAEFGGERLEKPKGMTPAAFERGLTAMRLYANGFTGEEAIVELVKLGLFPAVNMDDPRDLKRAHDLFDQTVKRMRERIKASLSRLHPDLYDDLNDDLGAV